MIRLATFLLVLLSSLTIIAQTWQLMTPVKTRSELPAVRMVDPTTGYMIDRVLGFVMKTTDAGATWERKPYNLTDRPRALWMWDDQRGIIAANIGRFYRTTDGWATATSVFQPTFGNMAVMAFANDTMGWAGSESGKIVHTTDGGATWTLQTSGTTNAMVAMHFVNEQLGFAAATGAILLRTTDGGANWTPLTTPITYNMRGIHFFDEQNGIAVGLGGEIIRTTDGGDSWTLVPSPTTNSLLGLFARGQLLIAMGNSGTVIRSINGGLNWTAQTVDNQDLYSAWVDPSGIGMLTGKARVYQTLNNGMSWAPVQIGTYHSMLNKVSFGTDQFGAAAGWQTIGGFENGAIRSANGGRVWTNLSGAGQWLGVHVRPDGNGWLGGGVGASRSTTDYFATSTNRPGPNVAIRSTWSFDATTAIVGGGYVNGGCYRTTNNGADWSYSETGNIYDLWFVDDLLGFCGGEGGALARTTDGGINWQPLTSPTNASINSIFFLNDTLGYIAGGGAHRTTDGGDTWTYLGSVPQYTMSIHFTNPDTGYAISVSGQVVRTVDGGDTWDNIVPAPFDAIIGDMTMVDGALIAVGRYGDVYRAALQCPSTPHVPAVLQSGETLCTAWRPQIQWYLNGTPIPNATWPCITADEPGSYTVVITDALGCTSAPSTPVQIINTGLGERKYDQPVVMPNPTSGMVTLSFAESRARIVELCDAQGRMLAQERVSGLTHALDLRAMPSGIYLIREAGGDWFARVVRE